MAREAGYIETTAAPVPELDDAAPVETTVALPLMSVKTDFIIELRGEGKDNEFKPCGEFSASNQDSAVKAFSWIWCLGRVNGDKELAGRLQAALLPRLRAVPKT
jgi:hypothetical protein